MVKEVLFYNLNSEILAKTKHLSKLQQFMKPISELLKSL